MLKSGIWLSLLQIFYSLGPEKKLFSGNPKNEKMRIEKNENSNTAPTPIAAAGCPPHHLTIPRRRLWLLGRGFSCGHGRDRDLDTRAAQRGSGTRDADSPVHVVGRLVQQGVVLFDEHHADVSRRGQVHDGTGHSHYHYTDTADSSLRSRVYSLPRTEGEML